MRRYRIRAVDERWEYAVVERVDGGAVHQVSLRLPLEDAMAERERLAALAREDAERIDRARERLAYALGHRAIRAVRWVGRLRLRDRDEEAERAEGR